MILGTPSLIRSVEHAARNALLPLLEPGESTVGVALNVEHTAATPLGAQVVCHARVIYADARQGSHRPVLAHIGAYGSSDDGRHTANAVCPGCYPGSCW